MTDLQKFQKNVEENKGDFATVEEVSPRFPFHDRTDWKAFLISYPSRNAMVYVDFDNNGELTTKRLVQE